MSRFHGVSSKVAMLCIGGGNLGILNDLRVVSVLRDLRSEALSVRLFYNVSKPEGRETHLTRRSPPRHADDTRPAASVAITFLQSEGPFPVTPIPCRNVSSRNGDGWDYAILAICTRDDSL